MSEEGGFSYRYVYGLDKLSVKITSEGTNLTDQFGRVVGHAAALASLEKDRLLLVTKCVYPDVARRFGTSWSAVERDLRTVIAVAWKRNPALLADFAQEHLEHKPTCARFLAILSRYLDPSSKLPNHISIAALHEPTSA